MHDHDGVAQRPEQHPDRRRYLAAGATALAAGWWATALEPFSGLATAAVVGAGAIAVVAGIVVQPRWRTTEATAGSVVPWLVLVAALAGWQLAAYLQHPRHEHPTISALTNAALDPRPVRAAAFAGWLLVAAWLGRRWRR